MKTWRQILSWRRADDSLPHVGELWYCEDSDLIMFDWIIVSVENGMVKYKSFRYHHDHDPVVPHSRTWTDPLNEFLATHKRVE